MSGQRTERCHQTEDLAQARGLVGQATDQHQSAAAGADADVLQGPLQPVLRHRSEGDGEAASRQEGLQDRSVDFLERHADAGLAEPIDGARRRRSGFAQYPDVVDDAVRRYLREVDGKPLRVAADNLGQMSQGDRLRLVLARDETVDLVGYHAGPVGFARDQAGDEPRLILRLVDQRIARQQAHRRRHAENGDTDRRRDDQDEMPGEAHCCLAARRARRTRIARATTAAKTRNQTMA